MAEMVQNATVAIPAGDWLSPSEAAIRFKISEPALRQRVHRDKLMSRTAPNGRLEVLVPRDPMQPDTTALTTTSQRDMTPLDIRDKLNQQIGELRAELRRVRTLASAYQRINQHLQLKLDALEQKAAQEARTGPQSTGGE